MIWSLNPAFRTVTRNDLSPYSKCFVIGVNPWLASPIRTSAPGGDVLIRTLTAFGEPQAVREWLGFETPMTIRCRSPSIRDDLRNA